jgi:hypothetical protein
MLTRKEQELLLVMLKKSITAKEQNIYKSRISFYKAIWKLRNMELIFSNVQNNDGSMMNIETGVKWVPGMEKKWKLRRDGTVLARILLKGE